MNYFRQRQNAFKYAFAGLYHLFRHEAHAKIHFIAAFLVLILAWVLGVTLLECSILILCIALVIGMEATNSAIEKLTDIATPEFSEKAGQVKDMAAGAVLVVSLASAIIGALIFIPKITLLFKTL